MCKKVGELGRVDSGGRGVLAPLDPDFEEPAVVAESGEGGPQTHQLVEDHAQGPNVRLPGLGLLVVGPVLQDFGTEVIVGAREGVQELPRGGQDRRNAEVAQLDVVVFVQKEVRALDVPVHDLLGVHVRHAPANLEEVFLDHLLLQKLVPDN